ncbi:MAG: ammonia channel protein, partial [Porticoccaceae bacterium]
MLDNSKYLSRGILTIILCSLSTQVFADDLSGANTSWILTSTALVLFMTIPGLSLFYGG